MNTPHTTLKPITNIAMIILWGTAEGVIALMCHPKPILWMLIGSVFGLVCGFMQILSLREGKNTFLNTSSAINVRAKLKATKWGRIYLYFLWLVALFLVGLSLTGSDNPVVAFAAAYFSMSFVREIVTLKSIFQLSRMQTEVRQ